MFFELQKKNFQFSDFLLNSTMEFSGLYIMLVVGFANLILNHFLWVYCGANIFFTYSWKCWVSIPL